MIRLRILNMMKNNIFIYVFGYIYLSALGGYEVLASPTYVQEAKNVPSIYLKEVFLNAGQHTIMTSNLQGPNFPDTVLRLWKSDTSIAVTQGSELGHNDDYTDPATGVTYRWSKLEVNVPQAGSYWIMVHSYSTSRFGTANVSVSGASSHSFTGISFGGAILTVNTANTAQAFYELSVVSLPDKNRAWDTVMFGVGCGVSPPLLIHSDDTGVGFWEKMTGYGICQVIVSNYVNPTVGSSTIGSFRVYVNDRLLQDDDGDGVGAQLEKALKTCDNNTDVYVYTNYTFKCSDVFNLWDSDRDGLLDAHEIFGIEDAQNVFESQLLPAWGASPAHKDLFIEVDYLEPSNSNHYAASTLRTLQDFYSKGSAFDLQNPDGTKGVNLHFDIGREPQTSDPESDFSLYGNWGGSQTLDWSVLGLSRIFDLPKDTSRFSEIRRQVFCYTRCSSF